jgi:hypothetical protein
MGPKSDKECEKRGDIGLLSEIIVNSIYFKKYDILRKLKLPPKSGDITNFAQSVI